jgi:4-amino-4-deoxy-L-arabinose transferase-like glycosyltransferase
MSAIQKVINRIIRSEKNRHIIVVLILIFLSLVITLQNNPAILTFPNRDSGLFLYMGRSILEGQIPYRDVWDHKPPVVFYINALGVFLDGDSAWGVWFLELIFLFFAAFVGFRLLEESMDRYAAIFGTITWLATFILLWIRPGGNFAEEYALVFQFGLLYLFYRAENRGFYGLLGLLIGIAAGICFFLKQNIIGIPVGILLYVVVFRMLARKWRRLAGELLQIALGFALVTAIFVIYYSLNNGLYDFWDAAFRYNFIYAGAGFQMRIKSILYGLSLTLFSGVSVLLVITWIAGLILLMRKEFEKLELGVGSKALLILTLAVLPIEFLLSTLSGRLYDHYYLTWLPVIALSAGFFTILWPEFILRRKRNYVGLSIILIMISLFPSIVLITRWVNVDNLSSQYDGHRLVEYIKDNTLPGDAVLIWGAEAGYHFYSDTRAPGRYVYQYPLLTDGYANSEMVSEFVQDLRERQPMLILDTHPISPEWPSIDSETTIERIPQLVEFVENNYEIDPSIKFLQIVSYKLNSK